MKEVYLHRLARGIPSQLGVGPGQLAEASRKLAAAEKAAAEKAAVGNTAAEKAAAEKAAEFTRT